MANMEASWTLCACTYRIWWPSNSKGGSKLRYIAFLLLPFVNELELFSSFSDCVASSLFTGRAGIKQNCKISIMQQNKQNLISLFLRAASFKGGFCAEHGCKNKICPQYLPVYPFAIAFPLWLSSLCSVFILLWCTMRIKSHTPNFITIFFQNVKLLGKSFLWMTRDGL